MFAGAEWSGSATGRGSRNGASGGAWTSGLSLLENQRGDFF